MRHKEVADAFELLVSEVASALAVIREEGSQAFRRGNSKGVLTLAARAEAVKAFLTDLRAKRKEWRRLISRSARPRKTGRKRRQAAKGTRTPRGLLTPHAAFCRPILQALVELGGAGRKSVVVDEVGALMADSLTPHDQHPVGRGEPAWRNRVAFARWHLVQEGLLSATSQHGVWEITTAGRRWLSEGKEVPHSIPGWRKLQQRRPATSLRSAECPSGVASPCGSETA